MLQQRTLKRIRPGGVIVNNPPLNMNNNREYVDPSNTLQRKHTLGVKVRRICTDVNGKILADADAGLIAANMMPHAYPVFLLGQWDKESGYKVGQNILPPFGAAKFYLSFVNGFGMTSNQIVTPFSGFNDLQGQLKLGDLVSVYTDSLTSPNYFVWIVISSNVTGLASILANMGTSQNDSRLMRLYAYEINLVTNFSAQLSQAWNYVYVDNLGNVKNNQVSYNQFNDPFNVLPDVLTIPTEFELNQYIGIYFFMVSSVNNMSINFNFKMIE